MSADHISRITKQLDIEYWRIIVWCISAATFVICSFILLAGWCMEHNQHAQPN
jgi:hypothetical protein